MLHVLLLELKIIEKMQLLRSTNMSFHVLGTNHTLIVNSAEPIRYSLHAANNTDRRNIFSSVRGSNVPSMSVWHMYSEDCDEMRLSVEFVTVGFLGICRQYWCD